MVSVDGDGSPSVIYSFIYVHRIHTALNSNAQKPPKQNKKHKPEVLHERGEFLWSTSAPRSIHVAAGTRAGVCRG